ncbi:DUF1365 domain-containing protein [Streptomyces sp. NPDC051577]|uniref:DUF1365 domain-containing protein n=1 Tax=Streptomyces sp. NPDC051577 TaxID=3155166 RepID=UPI0034264915
MNTKPAPGHGPPTPALYHCRIHHTRTTPLHHTFTHRTYLWLVDLDDLPRLPLPMRPLARFRARDHLGDPARRLRENLDHYLAAHGIDLTGGRILMLTHAHSLGHVFNPITLYWCRTHDGTPACTVAEVCNTYGERHCYLLRPDSDGRANQTKEFHVSPFFTIEGHYRMTLPEPGPDLTLTIHLEHATGRPLTATVRGTRHRATTTALLHAAVLHPLSTLAVTAHIRLQGIRLYLRGLPVQPRTPHRDDGSRPP